MRTILTTTIIILITLSALAQGDIKTTTRTVYVDVPISQLNVSDCYLTSVHSPLIDEGWLKVYPNPNRGVFNLEITQLKAEERISISILCINGQVVYKSNKVANSQTHTLTLNLEQLSKGVYFINVLVNQRFISRKLTII